MTIYGDGLVEFGDWLEDSDWAFHFDEYLEYFAQQFEAITGLSYYERFARLDDHYGGSLHTLQIENYLAAQLNDGLIQEFAEAEQIPANDGRLTYLRAVRKSNCSVYEVIEAVPGSHLILRDALNPGEPIRVRERSASMTLTKWGLIRTRIISVKSVKQITGGTVSIPREVLPFLLQTRESRRRVNLREFSKGLEMTPSVISMIEASVANEVAEYALATWIVAASPDPARQPQVVNMSGDDIEFVSMAFPIKGKISDVEQILNRTTEFSASAANSWNWLQMTKGESIVHGSLSIEGDHLLTECNSGKRSKRLAERLLELLGGRIGKPLKLKTSLEQAQSLKEPAAPNFIDTLPPEQQQQLNAQMAQMIVNRYVRMLDEEVPMLNGIPRGLVKTKFGREKVVNWLKLLENGHARSAADHDQPEVDLLPIWKDLGILKYRC